MSTTNSSAVYRAKPIEQLRVRNILEILPKSHQSILDVGTRDGFIANKLVEHFPKVAALDLTKPELDNPAISTFAGDITGLDLADNCFDVVLCTEVLEHIIEIEKACSELIRVAKHAVVIGVPFEQDLRLGKTSCGNCGAINPPYGHVNSFSKKRLENLFAGCDLVRCEFIGKRRRKTNRISSMMQSWTGNPYGTYNQHEGCIKCGAKIVKPARGGILSRLICRLATALEYIQTRLSKPKPSWIHLVFLKREQVDAA